MKILHTMIRVNDLEESIQFYCDLLGMKLLRKKDYPDGRFTLAFVGYGSEIAFIEDPNGYRIELIQLKRREG